MPDHPFALRDEPYAQDEVTFYRERDGLPPAGVGALAVAPDGTAWVGGLFGLARFDGGQWQQVGRDQPHCTLRVSSLLATGEALWVGMETGVARYQGGRWQRWWMDQPAPTRSARQLVADVSGKIWANIHRDASDARLTPWDLWRYDGEGWAPVEHPEPNLRALAAAPEGGLLAVNDEGLLRLEEGRYERWGTLPELAPGTKLTSLAVRGELVVVGTSGGLVVMEGGRGRLLRGQDGLLKAATVQRLHQGVPEERGGLRLYACGWGIEDFPGIETMHTHNGSNGTFRSQLSIFPKADLVVAAFVSRGGETDPSPPLQAVLAIAKRYASKAAGPGAALRK